MMPEYEKRLSNIEVYSTEERIVGRWIDGKPIYSKTVPITNTSLSVGDNNFAHGISNLKSCIKAELINVGPRMFPYFNGGANDNILTMTFIVNVDTTNFTIRCLNDTWGPTNQWAVALYYTKTTD